MQFFSRVKDILGLTVGLEEFLPIWDEIFFLTDENRAVYNLARILNERYTLALLSNINQEHYEYIKKTFLVLDAFHYCFTSFELGMRKPAPEVYKTIIRKLNVPAPDVFYTDDRPELVESALKLGLQAFVYKGISKLKRDLTGSGVDINLSANG